MAEWEREIAAERTRAALSELKRQGRRVSGRPPLGYRFDQGRLVEVPEEQAIVRRLERLQAQGLGAKAVAARLNRRCVLNPRTGRPWRHGTVRDILARLRR
jgi:DNA invertase Pin-like site-specific DNA recombinase